MPLDDVLGKARQLVAGGWAEPWSKDADGRMCGIDDEGLADYCLEDALRAAVGVGGRVGPAWVALEDLVAPASAALDRIATAFVERGVEPRMDDLRRVVAAAVLETGLDDWLLAPGRTRRDVVLLLGRAAARARAKGGS